MWASVTAQASRLLPAHVSSSFHLLSASNPANSQAQGRPFARAPFLFSPRLASSTRHAALRQNDLRHPREHSGQNTETRSRFPRIQVPLSPLSRSRHSPICLLSLFRAKFVRAIGRQAHLTCRRHSCQSPGITAQPIVPSPASHKLTEALCFDESYFSPLSLSHCSLLSPATSPATTRSPPASRPSFIPIRCSSPSRSTS